MSSLRPALVLLLGFTLLTGLLYPLLVTGLAQLAFPAQANGSLLAGGHGSRLIGQPFSSPRYFWSRPSATAKVPYDAAASSGANLGPLHPALLVAVEQRVHAVQDGALSPVPVDLVTASGSGLDPHISPAAALYQVERVAQARGRAAGQLRKLVFEHTEARTLGIFGEPRVNVLALNLALDELP